MIAFSVKVNPSHGDSIAPNFRVATTGRSSVGQGWNSVLLPWQVGGMAFGSLCRISGNILRSSPPAQNGTYEFPRIASASMLRGCRSNFAASDGYPEDIEPDVQNAGEAALKEKPQQGAGGLGLGLSTFGRERNNTHATCSPDFNIT